MLILMVTIISSMNFALRTRTIALVAEHLQESGREEDLQWVTKWRERLSLGTASLRTLSSLAFVVAVVNVVENNGHDAWQRDVRMFFVSLVFLTVFGVIVPASCAKYAAGPVISMCLPFLRLVHIVTFPVLRLYDWIDAVVRRLAGAPEQSALELASRVEREIMSVVNEGEMQGAVDEHEKELIESAIEFGDIDVENIMTPRTEIIAIPKEATLAEAKELIRKEGHSRIPVYEETIDSILGVLYAKDLLHINEGDSFDLAGVMRKVPFVPDNKLVSELLQEFRERKVHMAIVLDEYGGTSGLVTIEDILEELVGEIEDEYEDEVTEQSEDPISRIDDETVEVDARVRIDEINDSLDLSLPEHEDYETIGGLVFASLGRIPRVGEQCELENVKISVLAAEPRRIKRLRLNLVPPSRNESSDVADPSVA